MGWWPLQPWWLRQVVGVGAVATVLKRWLPRTPVLRHVLLEPPPEDPGIDDDALADLVGAEGTTTTRLAPFGKALVAGTLRDVTVEAGLVEPGVAVRVVEIRGGRVIVRPVRG